MQQRTFNLGVLLHLILGCVVLLPQVDSVSLTKLTNGWIRGALPNKTAAAQEEDIDHRPHHVIFDPLPQRTNHSKMSDKTSKCGGTILSDSLPRLRIMKGAGVNGTDKSFLEQSITFKHTRGETLCFKTQLKEKGILHRTNEIQVHVPAQYGDVHRRHVKTSSRRAANVYGTADIYRHPDSLDSQRHRLLDHLRHNHHDTSEPRHLVQGYSLRRENQYAREDWCTFYYWWNRHREHVHLIELEGPLISDITYIVTTIPVLNNTKGEPKRQSMVVSTTGQAYDPGHLGVKHLKVEVPHHILQTQNHYIVPTSLPDIVPTNDPHHHQMNKTVPLFLGDRNVNQPDEYNAQKAFFIDDPYQYPRFNEPHFLPEIIHGTIDNSPPQSIPRLPSNLPLHYDKGRLSGLVWDPFPHFRAYIGHVGDSNIHQLARVPDHLRYDLDLGYPYITGLKNEDQHGQMTLETTFSLLEEIVSTEVISGAIEVLTCQQELYTSHIQNDTYLNCEASNPIVEGPLQFNMYTTEGRSLWQQIIHISIDGPTTFSLPLFVLGDVTTLHVCSKHGICDVVKNAGRPRDMRMVHVNPSGPMVDGQKATDESRSLSSFLQFWEKVKQAFVQAWQWIQSHLGWVYAILILIGSLFLFFLVRRYMGCCGCFKSTRKNVTKQKKKIATKKIKRREDE